MLAVPEVREAVRLDRLLPAGRQDRRLIFCDEDCSTKIRCRCCRHRGDEAGLLIGPEGGFSEADGGSLRALPFVTAIPLGPRILRADTAAVAALAVIQATIGDWR